MNWKLVIAAVALSAGPALADNHAGGSGKGGTVSEEATTNGTLHPGHVAVYASGKYNRPAADFHLDGEPYPAGPGGYATTQRNDNANDDD